jgi:hypothetical protein
VTTLALRSPSQNGSSVGSDWDAMPPPDLSGTAPDPETEPQDGSTDSVPADLPICPVCGKEIIRDPSWKRMHKYHDECRANASSGTKGGGAGTRGATGKAEREAELIVSKIRSGLTKGAMALFMVDKFDGFCLLVNIPSVCSQFKAVLIEYEPFRKRCMEVSGGGSAFGLAASLMFIAAPIAAHHGLIPSKRIAEMLINLPFAMLKLAEQVKESEENLTAYMEREMKRARDAADPKSSPPPPAPEQDGAWIVTDVGPSYAS